MFCAKCGSENKDGAKFCRECGEPLKYIERNRDDRINYENNGGRQFSEPAASPVKTNRKPVPKKIIIGICAAVAALIVVICLVTNAGKTINLDKYLTVEATGYDGYGSASAVIDWNAMKMEYADKLSFTSTAQYEYGQMLSIMTPIDVVQEFVSVRLDQDSGLSNGDTVAYTWIVNEDLSKYVNCKVQYQDGTYTVSDLKEIPTFDAFADLNVEFSGISPSGTAAVSYSGGDLSEYAFDCDKSSGLKNGDTIEVSLSNTDPEYYVNNYGKIPESFSKTYTVSGLQEYVSSYSDLTEDFLKDVKREAEDAIYSYTASSYERESSLNNLEYAGYILNFVKDGSGYVDNYNNLYIIYKGDVSHSEGDFTPAKVYFPVRFSNILKGEGGELSYEENKGIVGSSNLGNWYSTRGYTNPLTCYVEIVESNRDGYTAECGDGFEKYSENKTIEKLDDIDQEYKETLYADAKDKIESYIASSYDGGSVADNLSFAGEYLLLAKSQGNDFENNNKYIVVFSANVSNTEGDFEPLTVYYPVEYDGIVKFSDDDYMVTSITDILGNSSIPDSWYSTKGYVDGEEMFSELITSNRDNYRYEVSDGLKQFGQ